MKIILISVKYASVSTICFRWERKLERAAFRKGIDLNRTNVRPEQSRQLEFVVEMRGSNKKSAPFTELI